MSVRRNTLINLSGALAPMVVMLVTVPLYLRVLGEERYGVLALVWLVLGYFSFLELGLGKATANQIAKAHDSPPSERSEIFWTALAVNASMGMLGAGVLWLVGDYLLTGVLDLSEGFRLEVKQALPWLIGTLPLALVMSVLNGALEGRNRFLAANVLQVVGNVAFQVVPLVVAHLHGPSLAIVVPAAIVTRVAMNVPVLLVCQVALPLKEVPRVSLQRARSLFTFGGWVAVSGIASPLLETIDRFLIGMLVGAKAVAHYTIAYQLATKLRVLPGSLARALFPSFSADDETTSRDLAMRSLSVLVGIMTPVTVAAVLLVQPFLDRWVGENLAQYAAPIAQVILVGVWVNSLAYVPLVLLQGGGRPELVATFHMLELAPFIAVVYLAAGEWGAIGAAVAWTVRVHVDAFFLFFVARISAASIKPLAIPCALVLGSALTSGVLPADWSRILAGLILGVSVFVWAGWAPGAVLFRQYIATRRVS